MLTGHHAAVSARVAPGKTAAVIGDGAERIILLGRHPDCIALGKAFGATDIVSERGDAAVERVRELTGGLGAQAMEIARPGAPLDASARAYIPELLPDVLDGRIEPGRVFDRVASLDARLHTEPCATRQHHMCPLDPPV